MTKKLWYSGCSMTVGDEIADILIDPDFFNADIWQQDDSVDLSAPITSTRNNGGAGANYKSPIRKNLRNQRLLEIFLPQYENVADYVQYAKSFRNNLKSLELQNAWPNLVGKGLGYEVTCGGEAAASAGWMYYQLLDAINKDYDVYIMSWTYPTRLCHWSNENYLNYNPGWQPAHLRAPAESASNVVKQLFHFSFDSVATINEYVESIVMSATLLDRLNKKWYFTLGEENHIDFVTKHYPVFGSFLNQYKNNILSTDLFTEMYDLTDHLYPKAMFAGHPRLEAHQLIAEKVIKEIKNDL